MDKYFIAINKERETRRFLRENAYECPLCGETGIVPLGSEFQGATWWEHRCGAYSGIAKTWEASRLTDWKMIDPETNGAMHPRIGEV